MPVDYQPARPEDIAGCIRLRGMTRQNAISAERLAELGITLTTWSEQVRSGQLPGFIGLQDGELAGYCFGDSDTGEIVVLALLPEHEGQGVGKTLLRLTMDELRSRGHERLFLGCSSNPASRSHGFYRHLGWRSTGEVDVHGDEVLEHTPESA